VTIPDSSVDKYEFAMPRNGCCSFDSHRDLINGPIPTLEFPWVRDTAKAVQLVRLTFPCAVRNVSLYLAAYASPMSQINKPPSWALVLWYGLECMEDLPEVAGGPPQTVALIASVSWQDVGRIYTLSTPTLFNSLVIGGLIVESGQLDPTFPPVKAKLRLLADDKLGCCDVELDYGPIASAPPP
jgi:hypothetical protein